MAKYLSEVALMSYDALAFKPSIVARRVRL